MTSETALLPAERCGEISIATSVDSTCPFGPLGACESLWALWGGFGSGSLSDGITTAFRLASFCSLGEQSGPGENRRCNGLCRIDCLKGQPKGGPMTAL